MITFQTKEENNRPEQRNDEVINFLFKNNKSANSCAKSHYVTK